MKIYDTVLINRIKKVFTLWEQILKEYTHRDKIHVYITKLKNFENKTLTIIIDDNTMLNANKQYKSFSFWYKKVKILDLQIKKDGEIDIRNTDPDLWEILQQRLPEVIFINDFWNRKINSEHKESIMLEIVNKLVDNLYKDVIDPYEQQLATEQLTADKMLEEFYKEFTKE